MTVVPADTLNHYLENLNLLVSVSGNDYIITGNIADISIELTCVLPKAFPFVFPKIFISQALHDKIHTIPHLNADLSLCLFDTETSIPNFLAPDRLVEATIRKAYAVLEQGIKKLNEEDFLDEFNAYWSRTANKSFYSNVSFADTPLRLKFYIGNNGYYIANSPEECIKIAKARLEKIEKSTTEDCIYIPLTGSCYKELPETQQEMYKVISCKSNCLSFYANFLQKRSAEKSLVVFSQPLRERRIVSAFLHTRIPTVNGFRPKKTPLALALCGETGKKQLEHVQIISISQERLFERGGTGNPIMDKRIGVVGCGSLGSNLAKTFAECGCYKFSFYDNQSLMSENIARHVCGFSDLGLKKTTALSRKLTQHNPNINVVEDTCDIHNVLNADRSSLNDNDYIFLTVANAPIEYRFVEHHLLGDINKPIIIMWVEPYALAGHALVLNKPQSVFKELFTEDMTFFDSVVDPSNFCYKREAGCQSTYIPYSGLDVKAFTIDFVKFFMSPQHQHNQNYHFMWTGNLTTANQYNVILSPNAYHLEDNKHYIERID